MKNFTNPKCERCGDTPSCGDGAWRVNADKSGSFWEHRCRDTHPQVGYLRINEKMVTEDNEIERVARAIAEVQGKRHGFGESGTRKFVDETWQNYRLDAIAAIAAIAARERVKELTAQSIQHDKAYWFLQSFESKEKEDNDLLSDMAQRAMNTIKQLRKRVKKTEKALDKIHCWLVCHPITSPEDMSQSFEEMEEVARVVLDKAKPVDEWSDDNHMIRLEGSGGKSFRCECECNVFKKHKYNEFKYKCNSCNATFTGNA